MKHSFCLSILLLWAGWAMAQFSISGRVTDRMGAPVEMATVRLFAIAGNDTAMLHGVQSDMDGQFFLPKTPSGRYRLVISSVGYKEEARNLTLTDRDLVLGPMQLAEDVQALGEVEVTGKAAELTVKGDTIEYNTAAYKTGEQDMVEDLLKKMSGVEVDKEGNVTVNGESVTGIRIDGKKFFGNDVQAATKNIPADMIEKIQVIDEKSDMAKLTGFEDDNTERIINLKLKENRKRGVFGNFNGGIGADMVADNGRWFGYNKRFMQEDFRYNAGLFLNILLGESQTTVIGSANNTNELRTGRGRGGMQGSNSGITWAENLGVNTNIAGKNGWVYGGDAQLNHSSNLTLTKSEKEQWTDDFTYLRNDTAAGTSNTWDAKTRLEFEWTIDTANTLLIKPEISYTHTLSDSYKAYDYLRNGDTATVGEQGNNGRSGSIGAVLKLTYSHKFLKPGRTLTLNGNVNFNNTTGQSHNYALNTYETSPLPQLTDQWTDKRQNALSYEVKASYVEPVYGRNHFIETALTFSQNSRWSQKNQYNDSLRTLLDTEYSNRLTNLFYSEAAEVNYKWKEQLFDLTAGLKLNPSQTVSTTVYGDGTTLNRQNNVWNFSPNASFKYKFGKKEFARIQYRGTSTQPSITQMEPVKDNSDAMNETVGNLMLLPAFSHTLRFMYSRFNQERFSSLMTGLRGSLTKDALTANSIYDENGKRYQQTVNAKAVPWSVNADLMYNTPFLNKLMQFNTRTSAGYNRRIAYVLREMPAAGIEQMIQDGTWKLGDESRTGNVQVREDLTLRLTHKVIDVGVRGNLTYSFTHNNLAATATPHTLSWSVTGDLALHLPRSWEIATDIGYTDRLGYGRQLGNLSEVLWNASVSKTWANATLALKATDLLNQKKNIVQTVGEDYVQYQRFNTLPTYFLVTFTYKLNRMGDLKATGRAARMQEMLENGGPDKSGGPAGPMPPAGPGSMPPGPPPGM
ncbi:MAG: TonB-dependent receptor [Paludibacteraceae bacterium]|nr:TonB-dependent receptor [Paludibacteraceae bacterium]